MDILCTTLQYLGSAIAVSSVIITTSFPSQIRTGFCIGLLGCVVLFIYALLTSQYAIVASQVIYSIAMIIGLYRWSKVVPGEEKSDK